MFNFTNRINNTINNAKIAAFKAEAKGWGLSESSFAWVEQKAHEGKVYSAKKKAEAEAKAQRQKRAIDEATTVDEMLAGILAASEPVEVQDVPEPVEYVEDDEVDPKVEDIIAESLEELQGLHDAVGDAYMEYQASPSAAKRLVVQAYLLNFKFAWNKIDPEQLSKKECEEVLAMATRMMAILKDVNE